MNNPDRLYRLTNGNKDKEIMTIPDNLEEIKIMTQNGPQIYMKFYNINHNKYEYVFKDWE